MSLRSDKNVMLNLFNSLSGKIEPFEPADGKLVKMYTCGPSTYLLPHIGNYRTFLFEDILQRYLEFLGYEVQRLMTLTDVEDKAIAQAKKDKLTIDQQTSKNASILFQDFKLLRIKTPDYAIRASSTVDQAAKLTSQLLDKDYAYKFTHEGSENVYFNPLKFKHFGELAHLDMSKWPKKKRRFHLDTYPGTPWNMGDFIIWHGCKSDDVCYDSQIGRGRPAWNIQDAAIVTKHLGFSIDVACGGIDNLVRHHDYTLAITESVSGIEFSKYWLHGAHLFVNGKKMSKSTGNVYYPTDIVKQGYTGEQLRFFLMYKCYRKKLNYTYDKFSAVSKKLLFLKNMVNDLEETIKEPDPKDSLVSNLAADFENSMNNDLDVKTAFDNLFEKIRFLHKKRKTLSSKNLKKILNDLHRIDSVLQCIF